MTSRQSPTNRHDRLQVYGILTSPCEKVLDLESVSLIDKLSKAGSSELHGSIIALSLSWPSRP